MTLLSRSRAGRTLVAGVCLTLPFLVGQGCPVFNPQPGGGSVVVRSPSIDQNISAGDVITVVYDATNGPVSGFYDLDGQAGTGDETTFASNLQTGNNRFTQLQTASLTPGEYHIGITAGGSTGYAPGRVILGSAASIAFTSPVSQIKVGAGVNVPVRFSAGVANFTYQVFYDTDGVINNDEVTIASGSSTTAIVEANFSTGGLVPGTYHVGARVTVPSGTVTAAYAPGLVELVTGAFVQVLSPTIGLVTTPGSSVLISVAGSDPSSSASTIRIFYDPDNIFDNGNDVTITIIAVTGSGTTWDTSGVAPGSYYIGAELQNGFEPPAFSYSPGAVALVEPGTGAGGGGTGGGGGGSTLLTVTTPLNDTTIFQGATFRVNWLTSLRAGEGTVRVFREPDSNLDDVPDGQGTRLTIGNSGIDARTQFVDFDSTGVLGTFFIGVTLTPNVGDEVTAYAPGTLTVSPLHFWAGNLATRRDAEGNIVQQTGAFQGAVFKGFNFMDNLGSAMIATDDYDGDGRNEIVLAAQYGKPFLLARDGRGAGEAYMIYSASQRYRGDFEVNTTGSEQLPGTVFSGVLPNPFGGSDPDPRALAGTSVPFTVDGQFARPFDTEGLRSITMIPDQDGDGKRELVFGFPWCNSYSLVNQVLDGFHPAPLPGLGSLENNGHFLRGGAIAVSSWNPLLRDREALSRHFDRVLQLQEVGQVFTEMRQTFVAEGNGLPRTDDFCPTGGQAQAAGCPAPNGAADTVNFPCEGFGQATGGVFISNAPIQPPRLADPMGADGLLIPNAQAHAISVSSGLGYMGTTYCGEFIDLAQIDSPGTVADVGTLGGRDGLGFGSDGYCAPFFINADGCFTEPFGLFPAAGFMRVLGTGFYYEGVDTTSLDSACDEARFADALPPYGCRILGQTTTQVNPPTTANRFGGSISTSGDFLLIGASRRTATRADAPTLPEIAREQSGVVYILPLRRPTAPPEEFPWALTTGLTVSGPTGTGTVVAPVHNVSMPYPHNYIIRELGYTRCNLVPQGPGHTWFNMTHPLAIIGAAPNDRIGEVTGLHDINNDGVEDFAVGGAGTNQGRGAVYVIYRRQPEVEGNYLLEQLQFAPSDPNRLNGLMILGEPGENLGSSVSGGGDLNDDFNNDGFADLLIGSPNADPGTGVNAGAVFILFGGSNLLNPAGGLTLAQLREQGNGMLITGARAGDTAGTTVAAGGDINGDNVPDILIAAPNASPRFDSDGDGAADAIGMDLNGDLIADDLDGDGLSDDLTGAGMAYVVFGGAHLTGTLSLGDIGTANLPGLTVAGRRAGDHMGGGLTQDNLLSRGLTSAGDVDGDGRTDLLLSSVLASPDGKTNAGEVYLIYGLRP